MMLIYNIKSTTILMTYYCCWAFGDLGLVVEASKSRVSFLVRFRFRARV